MNTYNFYFRGMLIVVPLRMTAEQYHDVCKSWKEYGAEMAKFDHWTKQYPHDAKSHDRVRHDMDRLRNVSINDDTIDISDLVAIVQVS